jgi:hypothetical protein
MRWKEQITKDTLKISAFEDNVEVGYVFLMNCGDTTHVNALYNNNGPRGIGAILLRRGVHKAFNLWKNHTIELEASGSNKEPDLSLYDSMSLQELRNLLHTFQVQSNDRLTLIKAIEAICSLPKLEMYYEQFGFKRQSAWDDPFVIYMRTTYDRFT